VDRGAVRRPLTTEVVSSDGLKLRTASQSPCRAPLARMRISAIVDARFSLIVDDETASRRTRRGGAQALGLNVAQSSTISLKRSPVRPVSQPVWG
jgi:hypothetical protein